MPTSTSEGEILTLKQVAEGAHVSVSYLAEIERGEYVTLEDLLASLPARE